MQSLCEYNGNYSFSKYVQIQTTVLYAECVWGKCFWDNAEQTKNCCERAWKEKILPLLWARN